MEKYMRYYIIYLCVISVIAFVMYGIDKRKARRKAWRTPEKTLILMMWLGGAYGAFLGMYIFRHKTQKWYFWLNGMLSFMLHTSAVILLYVKYIK